jgi:hypothetical protein
MISEAKMNGAVMGGDKRSENDQAVMSEDKRSLIIGIKCFIGNVVVAFFIGSVESRLCIREVIVGKDKDHGRC